MLCIVVGVASALVLARRGVASALVWVCVGLVLASALGGVGVRRLGVGVGGAAVLVLARGVVLGVCVGVGFGWRFAFFVCVGLVRVGAPAVFRTYNHPRAGMPVVRTAVVGLASSHRSGTLQTPL